MKNYKHNNDKGYTLKVDLEYPKQLHDLHILNYHFHLKE